MAERPDMTAALAEIRCPTLVIVGQEDAISPPAEMEAIARAIVRGNIRRHTRRRPHGAAGEPGGRQCGDGRIHFNIVGTEGPV